MMLRHVLTCTLFLACTAATEAADRTTPEKKEAGVTAKQLVARLSQRFSLEKGIDANTPLKDALEFLSDRFELTIRIDSEAFMAEGVREIHTQPVRLPRFAGVPLERVLDLLASQVNGACAVRPCCARAVSAGLPPITRRRSCAAGAGSRAGCRRAR